MANLKLELLYLTVNMRNADFCFYMQVYFSFLLPACSKKIRIKALNLELEC